VLICPFLLVICPSWSKRLAVCIKQQTMMLRSRLQQEAAAAATAQQLLEDEAPGSGSRLKSKDKGKRKTKNKSRAQMQVACINYWRNNPLTKYVLTGNCREFTSTDCNIRWPEQA
jgi:ABC-type transporter MlaC component